MIVTRVTPSHSNLICVVREVDFVEYLRSFVLDGLHLHLDDSCDSLYDSLVTAYLMRRILPLTVPQRLLQALGGVQGDGVTPRPERDSGHHHHIHQHHHHIHT